MRPSNLWRVPVVTMLCLVPLGLGALVHLTAPFSRRSSAVRNFIRLWTKRAYSCCIYLLTLTRRTSIVIHGSPEVFTRSLSGRPNGLRDLPRNTVILSNHQTDLDWLVYLWILGTVFGIADDMIVVVGSHLRKLPLFNKLLVAWRFPFVGKEEQLLRSTLAEDAGEAMRAKKPFVALIFPEGVFLDSKTRPKSFKFAKDKGKADYDHLVHPRTLGTYQLLQIIKGVGMEDLSVLDVTMAYPSVPPGSFPTEHHSIHNTFMLGISEPTVHIHLKYYVTNDVPALNIPHDGTVSEMTANRSNFDGWLTTRWDEKEIMLKRFQETGSELGDPSSDEILVLSLRPSFSQVLAFLVFLGVALLAIQITLRLLVYLFKSLPFKM
ncbi:hypothetical protein T439DRAFT_320843 [Meredithblackwellia eburnea MCA 4105]